MVPERGAQSSGQAAEMNLQQGIRHRSQGQFNRRDAYCQKVSNPDIQQDISSSILFLYYTTLHPPTPKYNNHFLRSFTELHLKNYAHKPHIE